MRFFFYDREPRPPKTVDEFVMAAWRVFRWTVTLLVLGGVVDLLNVA